MLGHLTGQQIGTVDAGEADYGDVLAVLRPPDGPFSGGWKIAVG